jgi:hypothetical protein
MKVRNRDRNKVKENKRDRGRKWAQREEKEQKGRHEI